MKQLSADIVKLIHQYRDQGRSKKSVSEELKLDYSTIRKWWDAEVPVDVEPELNWNDLQDKLTNDIEYQQNYCYVLGLWLGNGYINLQVPKYDVYKLRVVQNAKYVNLLQQHVNGFDHLLPGNKVNVTKHGHNCKAIIVHSKLIPNLFPKWNGGRKHTRDVSLVDWQQQLIQKHPESLIKGLYQTDGSRFIRKQKQYQYESYSFVNKSTQIIDLFTNALDNIGVSWTKVIRPTYSPQTGEKLPGDLIVIDINKRIDVQRLNTFLDAKS